MRIAYLISPLMLLAACGHDDKGPHKDKDQTEVVINAGDEHGAVRITSDKAGGGRIKIGGEGVGIDIKVPDFVDFDVAEDFDIDGVALYPGSKVTKVNVDANDKKGAEKAAVTLVFTSPAAPKKAADWMAGEFAKKSIKIARTGDNLTGTDKDGDDFTIAFAPDGTNSKGEVRVVSN